MGDITVVGLGLMGAALATAFQKAGHKLVVWNRTAAKCQPFRDAGAIAAPDIASALAATPITIVCIDDYPGSRTLLSAAATNGDLAGKTIVQLSTGTPAEARQAHAWMQARGAAYLDGAILSGPSGIGTNRAQILLSGDLSAWEAHATLLSCLGGTVRYEAGDSGAASALDLAWLTVSYGSFTAIAHACMICSSEQIGIDRFIDLFPGDRKVSNLAGVIRDNAFEERTATLSVWKKALQSIQEQARNAAIDAEFPDFVAGLLDRAEKAGHGDENVMAMIKVMTGKSCPAGLR